MDQVIEQFFDFDVMFDSQNFAEVWNGFGVHVVAVADRRRALAHVGTGAGRAAPASRSVHWRRCAG